MGKQLVGLILTVPLMAAAASAPVVPNSLTRERAIFVIEIQHASPEVCGKTPPMTCEIRARVRVERVLKDLDHAFGETNFDAGLRQILGVGLDLDGPRSEWTGLTIGPGQRYLLTTAPKGSPKELVEEPDSVELLTSASDSAGDVESVLRLLDQPLGDQVMAEAAALTDGTGPHGATLAEHIGQLLMLGGDVDFATLSQALLQAPGRAPSEEGRAR